MKIKTIVMLSLVALLAFAAVATFAHAVAPPAPPANVAQIWASSSGPAFGGAATLQFNPGQTIYLDYVVQSGHSGTLSLYDTTTSSWIFQNVAVSGSGVYTIVGGLAPGIYQADINGVTLNIAVASIFVLPESVIGALAALGAGLAAFGIFQYKRKKN